MPIVAPWLRPTNVLEAMQSGSSVGLSARARDQADAEMAQRYQLAQMEEERRRQDAAEQLRLHYDALAQARDLALRDDAAKKMALDQTAKYNAAKLLQQQAQSDALSQYRAGMLKSDQDKLNAKKINFNNTTGQVDEFDPATNTLNVLREGGTGGNLVTRATRGKMEQQEGDLMGAYDLARRLTQKLDEPGPITGIGGMLRRGVNNAMGAVGLDDRNPSDEAVVLANQFNAKIVRALRSDSNIAEAERKRIESELPKPEEWMQGPAKIRSRLSEYLQTSLNSVRENSERRGSQIPAPFMNKDEVLEAFKAGKLTKDDVVKWKSNNIWDLLNDLNMKAGF